MKRPLTIVLAVLLMLAALPLSACSGDSAKEDFSDEYNAETDFDPTNRLGCGYASVEGGSLFFDMSFLFYLAPQGESAIPLCNKPNCLHYQEKKQGQSDPMQFLL